jgi:hypothetical protein
MDDVGRELRVGPAENGKARPGEVLVKNHALAINQIIGQDKTMDYLFNNGQQSCAPT